MPWTRDINRLVVKPVYTYADYSCHYIVRRCGIITQMFPILDSVRGTKRSNKGSVIVGILGGDGYTSPQKEAISYLAYKVAKETSNKIDVYAVEDLEVDSPVKLNAKPSEWCYTSR